jgi:hypothetical protein
MFDVAPSAGKTRAMAIGAILVIAGIVVIIVNGLILGLILIVLGLLLGGFRRGSWY